MHTRVEDFINKKVQETLNIHTPRKFLKKYTIFRHPLTCQTIT